MTQQQSIYCPNSIFDNGVISIGEFKTMNDCMNYPIKDWCITREEDNKFDAYKRQGDRLLIICSWNRTDSQRFVVAIASRNHKIKYFDLNDLPMDLIAKTYEQSLGNDAISILKQYGITNESKTNKNMKKNVVRLNEQQLKKIVAESVKKVLKEADDFNKYDYYDNFGDFSEGKAYNRWVRAKQKLGADKMIELLWKASEPGRCLELLDNIERYLGIDV